jgi:uncharacterized protein (TIGR02145 family)
MKRINLFIILFGFIWMNILGSCDEEVTPPRVLTGSADKITGNSATLSGQILSDGGGSIKERGFLIGKSFNLTFNDTKIVSPGGVGGFTAEVSDLDRLTVYYFAAYATNSAGTIFGIPTVFITDTEAPKVSTLPVKEVGSSTALAVGNLTDDGGGVILRVGFCLSKNSNPTVNNLVVEGDFTSEEPLLLGEFDADLTDLEEKTKYYLRAFADNGKQVVYGEEVNFTTEQSLLTDIEGNTYETVTIGNQVWMAENLRVTKYKNGSEISHKPYNQFNLWPDDGEGYWDYANQNSSTNSVYGKLYNWYAVTDPQGLCPTGWHVASRNEWKILFEYLGGIYTEAYSSATIKLKSTTGWPAGKNGDNSSGFNAVPNGASYGDFGNGAHWFTSDRIENYPGYPGSVTLFDAIILGGGTPEYNGLGIRCIKD